MKKTLLTVIIAMAFPMTLMAQQGGCVSVAVGSQEKGGGKFEATFSATEILDVDFSVIFTPGAVKQFSGDHEVEFRVFTPRGHLYQSITIPFSADESQRGKKKKIAGYPRPVDVQVLESVDFDKKKHMGVKVRMPVAGTMIVNNSLYGSWSAQAYVDGETVPCSKPVQFAITQ